MNAKDGSEKSFEYIKKYVLVNIKLYLIVGSSFLDNGLHGNYNNHINQSYEIIQQNFIFR